MIPWSKTNPQAFAGLHNKGNRLLLIFDEASEIEDIIFELPKVPSPTATPNSSGSSTATPPATTGRFASASKAEPTLECAPTTAIDSANSHHQQENAFRN